MATSRLGRYAEIAVACLFVSLTLTHDANAQEALGRYSVLSETPSHAQRDVLSTSVTESFPEAVHTVGDAVAMLLVPTGYRLSSTANDEFERPALLALPLPAAHRALTGLPIRRALNLLVGRTFHLIEDPIHRLISFERCGPRATPTIEVRP